MKYAPKEKSCFRHMIITIFSLNLSRDQGIFGLPQITAKGTSVERNCPAVTKCVPNYPYRTMDGSCNNLINPDWGTQNEQKK
jgi:hypothetical protein